MKKRVIILCAMALLCSLGAKAQDPFKDLTKNESVVTINTPDIVDFVTYYLSEPQDELKAAIEPEWKQYLKNEKLDKGKTFTVDKKNGYVRYDIDYDILYPNDKTGEKLSVEFCYWNCADGLHKLFAENVGTTQNGKPIFTEFTGMYIYVYDNATQKLYMIDQDLLGLDEEIHGEVTFALPRVGKDIDVFFHNNSKVTEKKLIWNGKGFDLKDKKAITPKKK